MIASLEGSLPASRKPLDLRKLHQGLRATPPNSNHSADRFVPAIGVPFDGLYQAGWHYLEAVEEFRDFFP